MARKSQSVSFPPTALGGIGSGLPPPAMQTSAPFVTSDAPKNEDRRSLPQGRSFLWGLFSSSSSPKEPKNVRTKLSKAPPTAFSTTMKSLPEPRIGSISPELYNDPAFSSDPRSHLLSNSYYFLGPVPLPGQSSLKHEQPIDDSSRHSEQSKQSSVSPTDIKVSGVTPSSFVSAGPSSSASTPSLSFVQTPSPVTSTPSSSTSHATAMPPLQPLTAEPRSRSPHHPATYKLRIHNPDISNDDPPSYDESTSIPIRSEKRGDPRIDNSPPSEAEPSAAALRESPTHSQRTSPYETRSHSPARSFSSPNHSALVADSQASQPPQLPPQNIPQQMYQYQQQPAQRPSTSRHTTPEKSHPEEEAPQPTRRNAPLILRYDPPPEPQPTAEEHHQARAQAKRGRANQLDPIDELDQTNPLGMRLHHGGPYEAIQKVVNSKNKEQQNRPQRNHSNSSVENLQTSAAPAPFTPFGAPLNLTPGQILPHNFQLYSQARPLQNQVSTRQQQAPSQDSYQTRLYQPADVQPHPLRSRSSSGQVHRAADQDQYQRGTGVPFNPYDLGPIHHSQSHQAPRSHQPVPPVTHPAVPAVRPARSNQSVRQSPRPVTPVHEDEDAYGGIVDAYGGIEEEEAPALAPMAHRSERRSAPVPAPAANVTPGLNLQRSQTSVTPRYPNVPLGSATLRAEPINVPQPTPYPSSYDGHGRSNVSYTQPPPHGTPYESNSRILDPVGYEASRMRQPFMDQHNQPPPQRMAQAMAPQPMATPRMVYQQLAPQQRPPPPVRQLAPSIQSSSSAYRNGPPPKHLPSNLVMPTPLQNAPPKASSVSQPHRIDPRHQASSQFSVHHQPPRPSTAPSKGFGVVMLPSENQKIVRKGSSVAARVPTTGVAFAASIVDPTFTRQASVKPKALPVQKQKVPKRVLSKKRVDF
ncbi:uncharacterized protein BT62DRAFT_298962 [Guyanagaster necrorhizus]|uniref:Uncharacterized protein n=1 Tax=Guyanagaster necrorhizus TaxID=856835 RepID=A0A9P7W553_9AGAR|nr:uncharacterized protein BT62DRAFT_298962 [Guyanagaster necrorhizus MCA 3950]KAG7452337.1 hypothetical protein BT62DRAFT_298962 [Guyanagaster necrorhizus MCA 3950]